MGNRSPYPDPDGLSRYSSLFTRHCPSMPAAIDRKFPTKGRTHSQNCTDCGYPLAGKWERGATVPERRSLSAQRRGGAPSSAMIAP